MFRDTCAADAVRYCHGITPTTALTRRSRNQSGSVLTAETPVVRKKSRIAGGTACATKTSPVLAVVGQAVPPANARLRAFFLASRGSAVSCGLLFGSGFAGLGRVCFAVSFNGNSPLASDRS